MKKGFTLIELLVVVLIIGILSAVALPQYQRAVIKSRMAQAIMATRAVAHAQQVYYLEHGHYATTWADLDTQFDGRKNPSNSLILLKDIYVSIVYADGALVYASNYALDDNNHWAIAFDLRTNKLYCQADSSDVRAQNSCQLWNTEHTICRWASQSRCYPLNS